MRVRVRVRLRARVRVRVAAGLTEPTWLSPWLLSARTYRPSPSAGSAPPPCALARVFGAPGAWRALCEITLCERPEDAPV